MLVMMLKAVSQQEAETLPPEDDVSIERRVALLEAELRTFRADGARAP